MGNVLSSMDPEARKKMEVRTAIAMKRAAQAWDAWGHAVFHYSLVPGVFAFGLWYSGEFTMNPVTLFSKIFLA
jgi:hypothetical protein